jgi:hypothetical protein
MLTPGRLDGTYGLIVGYDDETQEVTIPDTYLA